MDQKITETDKDETSIQDNIGELRKTEAWYQDRHLIDNEMQRYLFIYADIKNRLYDLLYHKG